MTGTGAPIASPNPAKYCSSPGVQGTVPSSDMCMMYGACGRSPPHLRDVIVHSGAHVQGCHPERGAIGEPESDERVDQRERLNRLRRIEVVAFFLVDDVQPGTDTARGGRHVSRV